MASTIKLKSGSGAPLSSDLVEAEVAIDMTNKRLYTENSGGTVLELGTNPSSLTIGGTALTATAAELNTLDGITATTAELNTLDGITATVTELNYTDGVTSNIQTQLNTKSPIASPTFTGTVTAPAINVNGTVTADGLTSSGNLQIQKDTPAIELESPDGSSNSFKITPSLTNSAHFGTFFKTNDVNALKIANNGDISFYEDTGTTAKFFWDASAEQLNINCSSNNYAQIITASNVSGSSGGLYIQKTEGGSRGLLVDTTGSYASATAAFLGHNVGIGTSSPNVKLEVSGVTPTLRLTEETTFRTWDPEDTVATLSYYSNDATGVGAREVSYIKSVNDYPSAGATSLSGALTFGVAPYNSPVSEAMRIDSSGNVGIGTDSPATVLHVYDDTTVTSSSDIDVATFESKTASLGGAGFKSAIRLQHTSDTDKAVRITAIQANDYSNSMHMGFEVSNSSSTPPYEAARIDSQGHLLVGKTSIDPTSEGFEVRSNGLTVVTRDSDYVGIFNRNTNDGDIVHFRKDNSTVGSIGSISGGLYVGGGDVGVRFLPTLESVEPFNVSTTGPRDAAIDLGRSASRFKDLYLSGGVYLGGTAGNNLLDDYEQGLWTPTIEGVTSGSITGFTVAAGNYTKIGNVVHAYCFLTGIDMTSSTVLGSFKIGNLPITGSSNRQTVVVSYCNMFSFLEEDVNISGYLAATAIILRKGSSILAVDHSDVGTNTSASIMVGITYHIV